LIPAKTPKNEDSNLHRFALHRPSSKGTKLLYHMIKTIMNQNVCVSTCLSVCVCVSVYLCACIPLCLCASVYMYVSVYEYVCVRVCVCHLFAVQQGVPGAQHCVSYRALPAKSASNYICRNVITFDKCKTQTYFPRNQPVITFYKSAHLSKSTCTHSNIYPLHTHTHQHMQRNKYI